MVKSIPPMKFIAAAHLGIPEPSLAAVVKTSNGVGKRREKQVVGRA